MASTEVFQDAFFLTGLGQFIVPDAGFERWATHLRRVLLESVTGRHPFDEQTREFLACALSRYCFLTDYIFEETEEEQTLVAALKKTIEKQAAEEIELAELAILGCYAPLYHLKKARKFAEILPGGDYVSQIPKGQIDDFFTMEKIRKDIFELTLIENHTSRAVQVQYEEFPYPRRSYLFKVIRDESVEGVFTGKSAKILVAGCGTGREALELACVSVIGRLGVDGGKAGSFLGAIGRRTGGDEGENRRFIPDARWGIKAAGNPRGRPSCEAGERAAPRPGRGP